ncbi:MAG: hypothetical protein ACP5VP_09660 [Candidatus Limnocylindrales bacterium]
MTRPRFLLRLGLPGEKPRGEDGRASAETDGLARALEQYARAALDPDAAALARGRSASIQQFQRAAQARALGGHAAGQARHRRWDWTGIRTRLAVGLAGLVLVLGGTGVAVAASGPGGPLYGTRLDIETLALPAEGSSAWFSAEAERLSSRVVEAQSAARADNLPGVEAAVAAYSAILSQTVSEAHASPSTNVPPGLTAALDRHEELLASLLARVPPQAQPALRNALGKLRQAVRASGAAGASSGAGNGKAPGKSNTVEPGRAAATPGHGHAHPSPPVSKHSGGRAPASTPGDGPAARLSNARHQTGRQLPG